MTGSLPLKARLARHVPTLDRLAIGLSGLCAVHCVASVVLLGVLASAGVLLNPLIHEVGLALAMVIGALALGHGYYQHRRYVPLLVGGCGLGFMAGGLMVEHGVAEASLTVVGVSLVALGHWLNRRAACV